MIRLTFNTTLPIRYEHEGDDYYALQPYVDCKRVTKGVNCYFLHFGCNQSTFIPIHWVASVELNPEQH